MAGSSGVLYRASRILLKFPYHVQRTRTTACACCSGHVALKAQATGSSNARNSVTSCEMDAEPLVQEEEEDVFPEWCPGIIKTVWFEYCRV